MNDVFRVALPGVDVRKAQPQDLIVSSEYPNPKIYTLANPPHAGIVFLNWNTTTGIAQGITKLIYPFPHSFTYTPTVFASYQTTNFGGQGGTLPFQVGALGVLTIDADAKNINLKYFSVDPSVTPASIPQFTMQIKYYVMVERGIA